MRGRLLYGWWGMRSRPHIHAQNTSPCWDVMPWCPTPYDTIQHVHAMVCDLWHLSLQKQAMQLTATHHAQEGSNWHWLPW